MTRPRYTALYARLAARLIGSGFSGSDGSGEEYQSYVIENCAYALRKCDRVTIMFTIIIISGVYRRRCVPASSWFFIFCQTFIFRYFYTKTGTIPRSTCCTHSRNRTRGNYNTDEYDTIRKIQKNVRRNYVIFFFNYGSFSIWLHRQPRVNTIR